MEKLKIYNRKDCKIEKMIFLKKMKQWENGKVGTKYNKFVKHMKKWSKLENI